VKKRLSAANKQSKRKYNILILMAREKIDKRNSNGYTKKTK